VAENIKKCMLASCHEVELQLLLATLLHHTDTLTAYVYIPSRRSIATICLNCRYQRCTPSSDHNSHARRFIHDGAALCRHPRASRQCTGNQIRPLKILRLALSKDMTSIADLSLDCLMTVRCMQPCPTSGASLSNRSSRHQRPWLKGNY
jgi:hypothetical protein